MSKKKIIEEKEVVKVSAAVIVKELLEQRVEKIEKRIDRIVEAINKSRPVKGL